MKKLIPVFLAGALMLGPAFAQRTTGSDAPKATKGGKGSPSKEKKTSVGSGGNSSPKKPGGPPSGSGPNSPGVDGFVQNLGQAHPHPTTGKQGSTGAHQESDSSKFGSGPQASSNAPKTNSNSTTANPQTKDIHRGPKKGKTCIAGDPGCPGPAQPKQ